MWKGSKRRMNKKRIDGLAIAGPSILFLLPSSILDFPIWPLVMCDPQAFLFLHKYDGDSLLRRIMPKSRNPSWKVAGPPDTRQPVSYSISSTGVSLPWNVKGILPSVDPQSCQQWQAKGTEKIAEFEGNAACPISNVRPCKARSNRPQFFRNGFELFEKIATGTWGKSEI